MRFPGYRLLTALLSIQHTSAVGDETTFLAERCCGAILIWGKVKGHSFISDTYYVTSVSRYFHGGCDEDSVGFLGARIIISWTAKCEFRQTSAAKPWANSSHLVSMSSAKRIRELDTFGEGQVFGIWLPTVCWATTDGKCGRTDDSREEDGKMRRATPRKNGSAILSSRGKSTQSPGYYSQKLSSSSLCLLLGVPLPFSSHLNQHKKEEEMNVGTNNVKDPRLEQKIS